MKDSYVIIVNKLRQDRNLINKIVGELAEKEILSDFEESRYHKYLGKREYCDDLIEFFEDILKYLD